MNYKITYLYLILCSLFYTLFYFFYKLASKYISNINLIALQYIIVSIFFIIYVIIKRKDFIKQVNARTIGYSVAIGISSIMCGVLLYILLKTEPYAKIVPVLEPLIVIMSTVIGVFYFKNRLTMTSVSGIILSIIGIYLMVI